jgi:hypothetical protein
MHMHMCTLRAVARSRGSKRVISLAAAARLTLRRCYRTFDVVSLLLRADVVSLLRWASLLRTTGIWLHTGVTMVFADHSDAYEHFDVPSKGVDRNQVLCAAAEKAGVDTLQFTKHVDNTNYPCDTHHTGTAGLEYMGLELVGTRMVGTYACGGAAGAPSTIRSGWAASRACSCDNRKDYLNCEGVPELRLPAWGRAANLSSWMLRAQPSKREREPMLVEEGRTGSRHGRSADT